MSGGGGLFAFFFGGSTMFMFISEVMMKSLSSSSSSSLHTSLCSFKAWKEGKLIPHVRHFCFSSDKVSLIDSKSRSLWAMRQCSFQRLTLGKVRDSPSWQ